MWLERLLSQFGFNLRHLLLRLFSHQSPFCPFSPLHRFSFPFFSSSMTRLLIQHANNTLNTPRDGRKKVLNSICQIFHMSSSEWKCFFIILPVDRIINRRLVSGLRSKSSDGKPIFFLYCIHPTTSVIIVNETLGALNTGKKCTRESQWTESVEGSIIPTLFAARMV